MEPKWQRIRFMPATPLGADGARVTGCEAHIALSRRAATEGMVLLKNENETLPLKHGPRVAAFGKAQADYVKGGGGSGTIVLGDDEDELIEEAIEVIMDCRQASTSVLQRRLKLGYSRAARIIDQIEDRGIIGPSEGSKPRQILISREDWQEMKLRRTMPLDKQQ